MIRRLLAGAAAALVLTPSLAAAQDVDTVARGLALQGIRAGVTKPCDSVASLCINLTNLGSTVFSVDKTGRVTAATISLANTALLPNGNGLYSTSNTQLDFATGGAFAGYLDSGAPAFAVLNGWTLGWAATAVSNPNTGLSRLTTAVVGVGNGTPGDVSGGLKAAWYGTAFSSQSGTSYTVGASDSDLIFTAATTVTVTLPSAGSTNTGREIWVKTTGGGAVNSASSNVVPLAGGSAATGILAATAGKWAKLKSDGTNYIIMAAN